MRFSPGIFMNLGKPAPVPTKAASKPCSFKSWGRVPVRPTKKFVRNSTPIFSSMATSAATMDLGKRNSGIPYTITPPSLWKASKTVTLCPARRTSAATVNPAGPEPTTATFLPVSAAGAGGVCKLFSRSKSATKRSKRPIETERSTSLKIFPTVHCAWHCFSCGHTRPHIAGSRFVVFIMSTAFLNSPFAVSAKNWGIGTATGQPATQGWFLHCRQRFASIIACSLV